MQTIALHRKYGSVVRVMPNELSFDNAQAWEDIYGFRQGGINMHKDPIRKSVLLMEMNRNTDVSRCRLR